MLGSGSFQSGKGVSIRAESKFNKMNVPVMRKDFSRINVCRSTWDRLHKDTVRATLVTGRGASTIRKEPVRNCVRSYSQGLLYPAPGASKGNVINAVHFAALWAACKSGRQFESDGMFLSANCSCAPKLSKGDLWNAPKGVAGFFVERVGYELLKLTVVLREVGRMVVKPLPAIVKEARGISGAKLLPIVHECL
eukprot:1160339-Pelagomonas_calceolata.AAC.8